MNRRKFFHTLGIGAIAWTVAGQIKLPKSYVFQPGQIIQGGTLSLYEHCYFKHPKNIMVGKFSLACPNCHYSGDFYLTCYTDLDDLKFYKVFMNGKSWETDCWKCKFKIHYKLAENAKWREA